MRLGDWEGVSDCVRCVLGMPIRCPVEIGGVLGSPTRDHGVC